MSEEEGEYEVESVTEARAEVQRFGRAKKPKLIWKYRVRWKGYKPEDDTWEPIESFNDSEHIVTTFWERTNTNGRDIHDLTLFQEGETFLPLGPPRHKIKRKSSLKTLAMPPPEDVQLIKSKSPTPGPSSKISEKRRHTELEASVEDSNRPSKRAREDIARPIQNFPTQRREENLVSERLQDIGRNRPQPTLSFSTPSSNKKILRRIPSPEVIPDSDEEMNGPIALTMNFITPSDIDESNLALGSTKPGSLSVHTSEHEAALEFHPLFDEEPIEKVPTLRAHLAEPRVKMVDDPNLSNMEGAILAKAHAVARMNAEPSSSKSTVLPSNSPQSDKKRAKPGPGRSSAGLMKVKNTSSLLTFSKGSLTTVKGKYVKEKTRGHADNLQIRDDPPPDMVEVDNAVIENPPPAPPTGEELLRLAGLDTGIADALPDYEDNPSQMDVIQPILPEAAEPMTPTLDTGKDNESVSLHRESIELAKEKLFPTESLYNVPGSLDNKWKRPTIFGPLGLGSESHSIPEQLKTSQLYLNLDSSISIPISLLDAPGRPSDFLSVQIGNKGPSGKFYHMQAALALLGTLRASGTSAIVVVDEYGSAEDKDHFNRFSARLEQGDIFVAVAGVQILVFCSSTAIVVSQRLNAPTALLNEPGKILVSQVNIENYSGYADAAADADGRRWTQYISEH
ncbi:hypothetical protein BYT27DRAFT_6918673 [Phlegmacium glaucopus]|nr:hypothetical protein BYT27DRAFT_6918673 [Phlegmacium glaucopus]